MKSTILSLVVLLTSVTITSCRKDFTCTCSKIYKNSTGNNERDFSVKTYRDTRSSAETKCSAQENAGSDDTGNYSMNCQIEC